MFSALIFDSSVERGMRPNDGSRQGLGESDIAALATYSAAQPAPLVAATRR